MEETYSINVDAPPSSVWAVLADLQRWPTWTASIRRLELLGASGLVPGAAARIKQPGMPAVVWRVTHVDEGREFTWVTSSPGVTTTATHRLTPQVDGTSAVTLGVRHEGLLAPVFARVIRPLTRRFLKMEAEGLKRSSEQVGR